MSNLVKRAIFGSLYVGLILAALLLREHLVYMIVFGLLAFLGTWEWSNLVSTHRLFPLRRISSLKSRSHSANSAALRRLPPR